MPKKKTWKSSPLRYPGGKSRAVKHLSRLIPPNVTEMVAPFAGGLSLELYCVSILDITVYTYDVFDPLVSFWKCLLTNKEHLIKEIKVYPLPITKELFYKIRKHFMGFPNECQRAAAYFILNRCSFSGSTLSGGFTSYRMKETNRNPRFAENTIEALEHFELGNGKLYVERLDFTESLEKHSDLFAYVDPPYLISNKLYGKRGDAHDIDHTSLFTALRNRDAPWLLSYNDCEEIRELYRDFIILDSIQWAYGMSADKKSQELVIMNSSLRTLLDEKTFNCGDIT
jgi:DNA adenine methylase